MDNTDYQNQDDTGENDDPDALSDDGWLVMHGNIILEVRMECPCGQCDYKATSKMAQKLSSCTNKISL